MGVCKGAKRNGKGCASLTKHPSGYCAHHRHQKKEEIETGMGRSIPPRGVP